MSSTYFTNTLTRVTAGGTGATVLNKLNTPLAQVEAALNELASRIDGVTSKSAIIHRYAPMSSDAYAGALVYFDPDTLRYKPALAALRGTPGSNGASVEAQSARVEGIVLQLDTETIGTSDVCGTLLMGGYWEDQGIMDVCLGEDAAPGTYYLSGVSAGRASTETGGHLQQPVLSYHGGGKFCMNLMYMAHDNHYHGSAPLRQAGWVASSTRLPDGVDTGYGAWWYDVDVDADPDMLNIGELTKDTALIVHNGLIEDTTVNFQVAEGYIWYKGASTPMGTVTVFNHYPFAYGNAIIRGVESEDDSLSVHTRNGFVRIKANSFIPQEPTASAFAVSGIEDGKLFTTPVVSGLREGLGTSITAFGDGTYAVSSSLRIGSMIDAYNVNHNGTSMSSDNTFLYFTYPKGRASSLLMSMPVSGVGDDTVLRVKACITGVGTGASFNVVYYWIPQPLAGTAVDVDTEGIGYGNVSLVVSSGKCAYAEDVSGVDIAGSGLLVARLAIGSAPSTDIRLTRVGFTMDLVDSSLA